MKINDLAVYANVKSKYASTLYPQGDFYAALIKEVGTQDMCEVAELMKKWIT